jgi:hypothetical protein
MDEGILKFKDLEVPAAEAGDREGEAPAEPQRPRWYRLGRSLALPISDSLFCGVVLSKVMITRRSHGAIEK